MPATKKLSMMGANLDETLQLVKKLGGSYSVLNRTGEYKVLLPGYKRATRINGRRKDTPKILAARIGKILRQKDREEKVDPAWVIEPFLITPDEAKTARSHEPSIPLVDDRVGQAMRDIEAALEKIPKLGNGAQAEELQAQIRKLSEDHGVLMEFLTAVTARVDRLENFIVKGVQALFAERGHGGV